ncbi:hypothetical protein J14TS2_41920 [Bacillus sp. J14TS2]|uniref:hypothetical protein n=1 Tax=Bacillus sp. J14TS2 TaxID=2807188 RepID=UPI001B15F710|nr:hypothetical protein [Bacillus sp. J14TS2]GIN73717.1 hypothetical protein J14TS2_41920 [Bacillus sp. J14TS2]
MKRLVIESEKKQKEEKDQVSEVIKEMSPEELEAFKLERYRKFIGPLTEYHIDDMKNRK